MDKSLIQPIFAILVIAAFTGCGNQTDSKTVSPPEEGSGSKTEAVVEEVQEDLKKIAARAEVEALEVVEFMKEASSENIEIAKERLSHIKEVAATRVAKVVDLADKEIQEAGAVLEAVKEDAAHSLNNFLHPKSEEGNAETADQASSSE